MAQTMRGGFVVIAEAAIFASHAVRGRELPLQSRPRGTPHPHNQSLSPQISGSHRAQTGHQNPLCTLVTRTQ
mgnify:CR=1 FL=1